MIPATIHKACPIETFRRLRSRFAFLHDTEPDFIHVTRVVDSLDVPVIPTPPDRVRPIPIIQGYETDEETFRAKANRVARTRWGETRPPMRITCDGHEGSFTIREAAEKFNVNGDSIRTALRLNILLKGMKFRRVEKIVLSASGKSKRRVK